MNKWHNYFMDIAKRTAQLSYCTRLQVGAVAVRDRRPICVGFNGTPDGTENCCEGADGRTLPHVIHAEANLIRYAKHYGIDLVGTTLYITHSPCMDCAELIDNAGFDIVYFGEYYKCSAGIEFLRTNRITITNVNN